jgi:hypothetical protein
MKVCTKFTNLSASINVDIDAPSNGDTYLYASSTRWNNMEFSSSISSGKNSATVLKGTNAEDVNLAFNLAASESNSAKVKFTSFRESNSSFDFYGENGSFLVEGTAIDNSAINIINNALSKTIATNRIVHSRDKFNELELIGLGDSRLLSN